MKKIFGFVFALILLASCGSGSDGYTLNGTIAGELADGTQVFLKTTDSLNQLVELDTTTVTNGSFSFTGTQVEPKLHYLFMGANPGNIPFVLENGDIDVKFQKDSLRYAKVKGTVQNDIFMDFQAETRKLQERFNSMRNDMSAASQQRDTATVTALREEFIELQEEFKELPNQFSEGKSECLDFRTHLGQSLWLKKPYLKMR